MKCSTPTFGQTTWVIIVKNEGGEPTLVLTANPNAWARVGATITFLAEDPSVAEWNAFQKVFDLLR